MRSRIRSIIAAILLVPPGASALCLIGIRPVRATAATADGRGSLGDGTGQPVGQIGVALMES